jgi:hypothetical protein
MVFALPQWKNEAMFRAGIYLDAIFNSGVGKVMLQIIDHLLGCVFIGCGTAEIHFASDFSGIKMWRVCGIDAQAHSMY